MHAHKQHLNEGLFNLFISFDFGDYLLALICIYILKGANIKSGVHYFEVK